MEEPDHNFRTADIWRRPESEEVSIYAKEICFPTATPNADYTSASPLLVVFKLVDVHVYLVPSEKWIHERKLAKRDIIDHSVSFGFVRVHPSTTLFELRNDITEQLSTENVPEKFVFLRSVGRNFTQVKPKQELDLKVKSFIPPCAEEPEVYVKEGNYTFLRSASLAPELLVSRETSSRIPGSSISTESPADCPTTCGSARPSPEESNLVISPAEEETTRRTQSLDRQQCRTAMASRRAGTPVAFSQRQQNIAQRRSYMSRHVRPPTPRVKETPLSELPKLPSSRARSIASVKPDEAIPESPTEQLEERDVASQNLVINEDETRISINSPPPRPSSSSNEKENDIKLPVPTPTPTPQNGGKTDFGNVSITPETESKTFSESNTVEDSYDPVNQTNEEDLPSQKEQTEVDEQTANNTASESENEDDQDNISNMDDENNLQEQNFEQSDVSFENIHSKMGAEDVIVDPIKLLEGVGESLKNADENGRDHYDEGFHSGELVNSEEDSNSIETLGSSGAKDDEIVKPFRAATPMPRSNSFYKHIKMDSEIQNVTALLDDLKAERRLKELKRDALLHKVKDLQRRKVSSKDEAREEWRKRYLDVKKSTPRLEDHCTKLRQELEKLVKEMLVNVKTDPDSKPHRPSKKTSHKIMIMKLLQEVEDLRRRLQSVSVKLNAETKLRTQAEFEVKKLRQDLLHKKTQVTLTRKQASFPQTTELFFISAV